MLAVIKATLDPHQFLLGKYQLSLDPRGRIFPNKNILNFFLDFSPLPKLSKIPDVFLKRSNLTVQKQTLRISAEMTEVC